MWTPAVCVKEPVPGQCLIEKGNPERARLTVRLSTVPDESWREDFETVLERSSPSDHGVLECSLDGQYLSFSIVVGRVDDALVHVEDLCEEASEAYRERFSKELETQQRLNDALRDHFLDVRGEDFSYLDDVL